MSQSVLEPPRLIDNQQASPPLVLGFRSGARAGEILAIGKRKSYLAVSAGGGRQSHSPARRAIHCLFLRGPRQTIVRRWSPGVRINGLPFDDAPLRAGDLLQLPNFELEVLPDADDETLAAWRSRLNGRGENTRQVPSETQPALAGSNDELERAALASVQAQLDLERLQSEVALRVDELDRRQALLDKLASELCAREHAINDQLAADERARRQVEALSAELEARSFHLDEEEARLAQRQAASEEAVRARSAELDLRAGELELLGRQLSNQRSDIDQRYNALARQRRELDEQWSQFDDQTRALADRERDLEQRLEQLSADHCAAAEALDAAADRARQLDQRQRELGELECALAQRATAPEASAETFATAESAAERDELNELRRLLDAELAESAELRRQLDADREHIRQQQGRLDEQRRQLDDQRQLLHDQQQKLEVNRQQLEQQQRQLDDDRQQVSDQQRQLEASRQLLHEQQKLLDEDRQQLGHTPAEINAAQQEIADRRQALADEVEARRSELDSERAELQRQQHELANAQAELVDAQAELASGEAELERERLELRAERTTIVERMAELEARSASAEVNSANERSLDVCPADEDFGGEVRADDETADDDDYPPRPYQDPFARREERQAPGGESPASLADASLDVIAQRGSEAEDEQSIERYMEQLLRRTRGQVEAADAPKPISTRPQAASVEPAPVDTEAAPVAEIPRMQELPRRSAPAATDLSAMRDLANMSARAAIDTHSRGVLRNDIYLNAIVCIACVAVATLMLSWTPQLGSLGFLCAAACFLGALVWGARLPLMIAELARPAPPSTDVESAAAAVEPVACAAEPSPSDSLQPAPHDDATPVA